jgi:hypothetical protein
MKQLGGSVATDSVFFGLVGQSHLERATTTGGMPHSVYAQDMVGALDKYGNICTINAPADSFRYPQGRSFFEILVAISTAARRGRLVCPLFTTLSRC